MLYKLPIKNLLEREKVNQLKEIIIHSLNQIPGKVINIDFSDIEYVNASGIDELFRFLISQQQSHSINKYFYLTLPINKYEHAFNIHQALLPDLCVVASVEGEFRVLGGISKVHKKILEMVYSQKELTSNELSRKLGIKLNLAATHLLRLYEMKLVMREEHNLIEKNGRGRFYLYRSLF